MRTLITSHVVFNIQSVYYQIIVLFQKYAKEKISLHYIHNEDCHPHNSAR